MSLKTELWWSLFAVMWALYHYINVGQRLLDLAVMAVEYYVFTYLMRVLIQLVTKEEEL